MGGAVEVYGGVVNAIEEIDTENCKFKDNTATDTGGAIDIHNNTCFKITLKDNTNSYFTDYFIKNHGSQNEDIYIHQGAKFEPKKFYDEGKALKKIIDKNQF
ncbi:MAG: hypothetical protein LBB45_06840 [Methanobrevibacter sp.]|nr:hypothetical protein [Candidatus Methanovirga basalitermitum]